MLFLTLLLLGEMTFCDWYTAEIYTYVAVDGAANGGHCVVFYASRGDDVVGSVAGDEGYVVDGISAGVDDVVVICAAARGDDDVDSVLVVEIILTTVLLWRR